MNKDWVISKLATDMWSGITFKNTKTGKEKYFELDNF